MFGSFYDSLFLRTQMLKNDDLCGLCSRSPGFITHQTHPGRVLMLFLTSCTPVPVVLSKTIIQNVFRSCLTFKFGLHQVFLLFAFPQVIKQTLLCDSSYVQFLSGKQDWLPPWFPCPSCFSLKEIKEPHMYCVCLKYDGPVINTKITHTQSREAIFF